MRVEVAAYLAGVIDGEGYLSLTRKQLSQCRWPTFGARLGISNTEKAWLEGLQREIGGWLRQVGQPTGNRKPCYALVLEGAMLIPVLAHVQPFLRIKQERAVMILRYFDLAARRRLETPAGGSSPENVITELETLYQQQKRLNWRGNGATAPAHNHPSGRLCGVQGCLKAHFGRGYCHAHYKKYITRGGPARHDNICVTCGAPFVSKRNDARFCSVPCQVASRRLTPSLG